MRRGPRGLAASLLVLLVALGTALALACARPEAPPPPRKAGPPPTPTTEATPTSTPAPDLSPATLFARAICWLDDPAKAAGCLPPSDDALAAIRAMGDSGDRRFVAPLIDMRALEVGWSAEVSEALAALTGQRLVGADWYGWLAANPQPLTEDYARWKGRLLAFIDPTFASLLRGSSATGVRPELVMWSGVRPGELPRLEGPPVVAKEDAGYLEGGDAVYALQAGDITRAYPRRILAWHPVIHDVVGGVPVVVTYCGPCESASAFVSAVGGRVLRLRDAGLWLAGRPLLVDEQTGTLWDAYSGRALLGPLAAGGVVLERRALVTTTWGDWTAEHPATGVLALATGFARDYSAATQRARDATFAARFPASPIDARLPASTRVVGVVAGNEARAYLLDEVRARQIVLDTLVEERLLLLTPGAARAARVYRAGALNLRELHDDFTALGSDGRPGERWWIEEQALVSQLDGRTFDAGAWLESTWAAWSSAYPHTSIWGR